MISLEGSLSKMTQSTSSHLGDLTRMLVTDRVEVCLVLRRVGNPPYFSYMVGRKSADHLCFTPFSKYIVIQWGSSVRDVGPTTAEAATASAMIRAKVEGTDIAEARMTSGAVRSLAVNIEEAALREAAGSVKKDPSPQKQPDAAESIAAKLLAPKKKKSEKEGNEYSAKEGSSEGSTLLTLMTWWPDSQRGGRSSQQRALYRRRRWNQGQAPAQQPMSRELTSARVPFLAYQTRRTGIGKLLLREMLLWSLMKEGVC